MKTASNEKTSIQLEDKEGTIAILTHSHCGPHYEFETFTDRDDALCTLWGAYRTNQTILYCSDEEALKLHEREVALDD